MISYKMYEKNLISSINVNFMHIFEKVKFYLFHWKFAFPSDITVDVFLLKNLVPVTHFLSQIYFIT